MSSLDIVNQNILLNLGRVSATFNQLEFVMGRFIAELINKKDTSVGDMIACELRFSAKLAVLMSLYEYRVKDSTNYLIISYSRSFSSTGAIFEL
jgi:hypothetical protein